MRNVSELIARKVQELLPYILPFADAGTKELSLIRILRLSLFQIAVGMAIVLLYGTLNRVMVVELGVPAWFVALAAGLPMLFAPVRALIGHRSDYHHSAFGWRRVPYLWMGGFLQFAGFALMPYSILLLADGSDTTFRLLGQVAAAISFLMVGAGLHTIQTAGLALASDLAPAEKRPRVVALLYIMLLLGMGASALLFGHLLRDFSHEALVRVVHGVSFATIPLILIATWKQEAINMKRAIAEVPRPPFKESWRAFIQGGLALRLLIVLGLGTAGFSMQEILLEPYGAQILGLSVSQTTVLTAILAGGNLAAFSLAAYTLSHGASPYRLAGYGTIIGVAAFVLILFAALFDSPLIFRMGTAFVGFGAGLLGVGTLIAAMGLAARGQSGLALGAWGAVQATSQGVAIALGGGLRDLVTSLAQSGVLGAARMSPIIGYGFVYLLEIVLLIAAIVVLLPLFLHAKGDDQTQASGKFGLDQMPS